MQGNYSHDHNTIHTDRLNKNPGLEHPVQPDSVQIDRSDVLVVTCNILGAKRGNKNRKEENEKGQDKQCTYNVTWRSVHATVVDVEKQVFHSLCVYC